MNVRRPIQKLTDANAVIKFTVRQKRAPMRLYFNEPWEGNLDNSHQSFHCSRLCATANSESDGRWGVGNHWKSTTKVENVYSTRSWPIVGVTIDINRLKETTQNKEIWKNLHTINGRLCFYFWWLTTEKKRKRFNHRKFSYFKKQSTLKCPNIGDNIRWLMT